MTETTMLDEFFDGSIADGIIIDIFGSAGAGKTQLAMQMAIRKVSKTSRVLFADTTGAFRPERMLEMLQSNSLPRQYMDRIDISRIINVSEQIGLLDTVDPMKYSMIIIDNVSELFLFEYPNESQFRRKNKLFLRYMKDVISYALENKITIVLTNMTRNIDGRQVESHDTILDMFTHVKIKLEKTGNQNTCTCATAFAKTESPFEILSSGLTKLP